ARAPAHLVPYRANLWALRSLGARQVISLSAVGSLRADLGPGTLVVPDQIVDRTHGRQHTLFDAANGVVHASFADPYCPHGRAAALDSGLQATDGGALVVINGPRFSTRADAPEHQPHGCADTRRTPSAEAGPAP